MISKCIRRLSFRSLADDREEKHAPDGNNNRLKDTQRLPAPVAVKPSWTSSIWDTAPTDRPRDSQTVAMCCSVFLQQSIDTDIVSVVLHRADRSMMRTPHGDVVASSAVSTNIQHGALSVELQSQGEHYRLTEPAWRGEELEKQFVLSHKTPTQHGGVLGKVVVRHCSLARTLFELYVLPSSRPSTPPPTPLPADLAWGAAGFREIAALLELVDEDSDVTQLAKDLGFTEREMGPLEAEEDPFCALLATYAARGGTPQELLRAMYSCRRGRGLGTVGASPPSPRHRLLSQCSSFGSSLLELAPELDVLEEAALLSPITTPNGKRKRSTSATSSRKRSRISTDETADYDLDFCDAATLPVGDLDCGIDQTALPPTPPATPLKRVSATSRN